MSTLFLDHRDLRVQREGQALAIYRSGERHGTVPFSLLERVVARGAVALDTAVLGELADAGIATLILSGRQGRHQAIVLGGGHGEALRRIAQYHLYRDDAWRLRWSQALVHRKVISQRRLLGIALRERSDLRRPLFEGSQQLAAILETLRDDTVPRTLDSLRGSEGAAARSYFAALGALFPPSLNFTGRNRRPPRDPVNAALSLGYTLLHFEAVRASHGAGLDPLIGFFHELEYHRESLAADLVEPLRAQVDRWVWDLFRTQALREQNFQTQADGCLLNKAGREIFYRTFEARMPSVRRLLRRACYRIAARLLVDSGLKTTPTS
ncbi:CRISPR-associated endonuclease Cas1 [Gammaproteobacteria bacterium]